MKSIIACFILFGGAFAFPDSFTFPYDDDMDKTIKEFVPTMRERNYTFWNFGPSQFGKLKFGAGQIVGIDSLLRSGPSYMIASKGAFVIDAHINWNFLGVVTPDLTIEGQAMSGIINLSGVKLYVMVALNDGCFIEVRELTVVEVQSAVLFSSVPDYNRRNIITLYRNSVVPGVNDELEKNMKSISSYFHEMCKADKAGLFA